MSHSHDFHLTIAQTAERGKKKKDLPGSRNAMLRSIQTLSVKNKKTKNTQLHISNKYNVIIMTGRMKSDRTVYHMGTQLHHIDLHQLLFEPY